MRDWLATREPRDRVALTAGAVAAALALLYALAWQPLQRDVERNRVLVEQQRETLGWMRQAAAEVARLRAAGAEVTTTGGADQSLVGYLELSAREAGVREHITRMEPVGSDSVRLTMSEAPFDSVITWLAGLDAAGRPHASAFSATRAERSGLVDATLTLERGDAP